MLTPGRLRRGPLLLDRYWAALRRDRNRNRSTAPPDGLEPALADLAVRLAADVDALAPDGAFDAALRQRVVARAEETLGRDPRAWSGPALNPCAHRPRSSASLSMPDDKEQTRMSDTTNTPLDLPLAHRRWRRDALALVAAVLALALVGAVLALVLRDDNHNEQVAAPVFAPTAVATPSAVATATATATATTQPATATVMAVAPTSTIAAPTATPALPSAGAVVASIAVAKEPAGLVAGVGAIWVPNAGAGTVSRIDPATNTVVATIVIGATPRNDLETSPSFVVMLDDQVWVSDDANASIVRIDPASNQIVDRLPIPGVEPFTFRAMAAGAGSIWLSDNSYSRLLRVDPASGAVTTIAVGAFGIAVSDDAVWVAEIWANTVARVDPATNTVVARIKVGFGPSQIAVGAGGVWVTNQYDESVSRIDPATNQVVATIEHVHSEAAIVADAGGVWADRAADGGAYRIDPTTNQIVATLPADRLGGIAISDSSIWFAEDVLGVVLRVNPAP